MLCDDPYTLFFPPNPFPPTFQTINNTRYPSDVHLKVAGFQLFLLPELK